MKFLDLLGLTEFFNNLKTYFAPLIHKHTKADIEDLVEVQSDWNENDLSSPHYIKNRTHWKEPGVITVIPEQVPIYVSPVNDSVHLYHFMTEEEPLVDVGKVYNVTFDGVQYDCISFDLDGSCCIGNLSLLLLDESKDTGEPFAITIDGFAMITKTDGSHTVSCTTDGFIYHKLSTKYLEKGEIVDGIFWHKSDAMTLEEAKTYEKIFLSLNTGFILRWNNYIITRMQVDNSTLSFYCGDFTTLYVIRINDNGVFDISDVCTSNISIGDKVKYGVGVSENGPVTVSPETISSGNATENTVFKVGNDGMKNKGNFEVLGNGTVKAYSVILPSTTTDSTKKFRITVDDTGTLSATEVTS